MPTDVPDGIAVDALVQASADGLPVMESPGRLGNRFGTLPAGQPAMIVTGPVVREDLTWYLLSGLGLPPNTGCEEPYITIAGCPVWIGWTPVSLAGASLEPVAPGCAAQSDYEAYAAQPPIIKLICARGTSVMLTAWWAGRSPYETCIDSPPGVDWLYCALALGGWLAPSPDKVGIQGVGVAVDPASGVVLPEPSQWVVVTGHVDDPAATACAVVPGAPDAELAAWSQVLQCRSTLVVESMVLAPRSD